MPSYLDPLHHQGRTIESRTPVRDHIASGIGRGLHCLLSCTPLNRAPIIRAVIDHTLPPLRATACLFRKQYPDIEISRFNFLTDPGAKDRNRHQSILLKPSSTAEHNFPKFFVYSTGGGAFVIGRPRSAATAFYRWVDTKAKDGVKDIGVISVKHSNLPEGTLSLATLEWITGYIKALNEGAHIGVEGDSSGGFISLVGLAVLHQFFGSQANTQMVSDARETFLKKTLEAYEKCNKYRAKYQEHAAATVNALRHQLAVFQARNNTLTIPFPKFLVLFSPFVDLNQMKIAGAHNKDLVVPMKRAPTIIDNFVGDMDNNLYAIESLICALKQHPEMDIDIIAGGLDICKHEANTLFEAIKSDRRNVTFTELDKKIHSHLIFPDRTGGDCRRVIEQTLDNQYAKYQQTQDTGAAVRKQ